MSAIWTPVPEGPHEAFVERLHRAIEAFAESQGIEQAIVEVELMDTARFVLDRIEPHPGFGMITVYIKQEDPDAPAALIVPIGSIRRIELRTLPETRVGFGFSVPSHE